MQKVHCKQHHSRNIKSKLQYWACEHQSIIKSYESTFKRTNIQEYDISRFINSPV